jgi:hypothetical protein
VFLTWLAGQVIEGCSVSFTVTVNEQVLVLPAASVALKVLVVVPTGKVLPDGNPAICCTTGGTTGIVPKISMMKCDVKPSDASVTGLGTPQVPEEIYEGADSPAVLAPGHIPPVGTSISTATIALPGTVGGEANVAV